SAAIARGGTAVLGGATLAGAAPAPARVPAVSTATAARWAPAQAPAVAAPPPIVSPSAPHPSPGPATSPGTGRSGAPGHEVIVTHTRIGRDPGFRRQAEDQPEHVSLGGTTIGLDPHAAADEALQPVLTLARPEPAQRRNP
ncbi:MAG: hypothetical protein ACYDAD_01875, partial [Acidimicrobiales bacterium]